MAGWFRSALYAAGLATLAGMALAAGSALTSPDCRALSPEMPYDLAIVLSAGGTRDPLPRGESRARAEAAIDLHARGAARRLHFAGNGIASPDHAAARQMAELARRAGVPGSAIGIEDRSRSTLENALFSSSAAAEAERLLLVSTGYHLWRGAASLAWAGVPPDAICRSSAFGDRDAAGIVRLTALELVKWWANGLRAALWSGANALGRPLPEGFLH